MQPARKPRLSYQHTTGYAALHGPDKDSVHYASPVERDFLILMDFDPKVVKIYAQPLTIKNTTGNPLWKQFTPDFLVEFAPELKRKPELVEVKDRGELKKNWPVWRLKFKAGTGAARQNGWVFKVYHDLKIRTAEWVSIDFLRRYLELTDQSGRLNDLMCAINPGEQLSVNQLLERAGVGNDERPHYLPVVWHLLANKLLRADLSSKPSRTTQVWLP